MEEDIEIILDDDEIKPEKKNHKKSKNGNKNNNSKKEKKVLTKGQKIFLICNILIVLGIIAFYGYRLVYYYKLEHNEPEAISLKKKLTRMDNITYQNDGLYEKDNEFYYKGTDVDNYLFYSGRMYRIISISDGIKIINDEVLTNVVWQTENNGYAKSNIAKWLNNYLDTIDKTNIKDNKWCDKNVDINNYQCDNSYQSNIGLLSIDEYFKAGGKNSYLNNGNYFWTINYDSDGLVYYINNEGNINNVNKNEDEYFSYGIREVITLKDDVLYVSGKGTENDPYIINDKTGELLKDNDIMSYVSDGDYLFRILDKDNDGVSLILVDTLEDEKNYNEINKYLKEFQSHFNEKDLVMQNVITNEYNNSNHYDYEKEIKKEKQYVRIPNIGEIMFTEGNNFWLNTIKDNKLGLVYTLSENNMFFADLKSNKHLVKPIIKLKGDIEISGGIGTIDIPLIIENEGDNEE